MSLRNSARKGWREGRRGELSRVEMLVSNFLVGVFVAVLVLLFGAPGWAALGFGLLAMQLSVLRWS